MFVATDAGAIGRVIYISYCMSCYLCYNMPSSFCFDCFSVPSFVFLFGIFGSYVAFLCCIVEISSVLNSKQIN